MSIPLDVAWRGCAANYPQPIDPQDVQDAEYWLKTIHSINCVKPREEDRLAEIIYRSGYQQEDILRHVFRWDDAHPEDVFQNGFRARRETGIDDDAYLNLYNYVHKGGRPLDSRMETPYVFISTTISNGWFPIANSRTERVVYRYEIYAPGGIWVAPTLGDRYRFSGQDEVSFVGGIDRQYIRSAQAFRLRSGRDATAERVNHSIFINRYFNPEQGTQLRIERPVIYYKENNQNLPLEIVDYPPQDQEPMKQGVNTDTTGWYVGDVANITSYISAAFRSSRENEAYIFMENQYVLVNYAPGKTDDTVVAGPFPISGRFTSLTDTVFAEHGIDCAFGSHHENEAFIFSGNICAQINYAPHTTNDKIIKGPMTIVAMFSFFKGTMFEKGVDAAFESSTIGRAYIFRDDHYALINYGYDTPPSLIAIRQINIEFPSLKGTIFESGIEAAFASHIHNEAYLFKGDSFARINFAPGTKNDKIIGGVTKIYSTWRSLGHVLPVKNDGLDLRDDLKPDIYRDHDEL